MSISRVPITKELMEKYAAYLRTLRSSGPQVPIDREVEIIKKHHLHCPMTSLFNYSITKEDIKKAVDKSIKDSSILNALMCFNEYKPQVDRLRVIGEPSVDGYAMLSDGGLFVVKAPREKNNDLIHEYFVGIFGTNELRSYIPNFAYILGMFECSPPYIEGKRVVTFCQNNKDTVVYVIYENVSNSVTLAKFTETCSFSDFFNVMVQISMALQMAYDSCRYTHYDLHAKNVLIRRLEKPIVIRYSFDGKDYYITTSIIATFIDYGRNYIEYNGEKFGLDVPHINIFADRSFPMGDIYHVLMFALLTAFHPETSGLNTNYDVTSQCSGLVNFFNLDAGLDVLGFMYDLNKSHYELPVTPQYGYNIEPKVYINHILSIYGGKGIVTTSPPIDIEIYGCGYKVSCSTITAAIEEIAGGKKTHTNVDYFFYLLKSIKDTNKVLDIGRRYKEQYLETLLDRKKKLGGFRMTKSEAMQLPKTEVLEYIDWVTRSKNNDDKIKFIVDKYNMNVPVRYTDYSLANELIREMKRRDPSIPLNVISSSSTVL